MQNTGNLKVTTPSDREIVMTRVFNAPRRMVYAAFTRPELIQRWLTGPDGWSMPICDSDLRAGGRFRIVWRNRDGRAMGMGGAYREIVPPERTVHTELFDEDWTGGETVVTTLFTEQQGRTTVTMTVLYSSRQARNDALHTGMTDGMAQSYGRLDALLASMRAHQ